VSVPRQGFCRCSDAVQGTAFVATAAYDRHRHHNHDHVNSDVKLILLLLLLMLLLLLLPASNVCFRISLHLQW
jgi:hypothetical protein